MYCFHSSLSSPSCPTLSHFSSLRFVLADSDADDSPCIDLGSIDATEAEIEAYNQMLRESYEKHLWYDPDCDADK